MIGAMRTDGRPNDALRPIKITRRFTQAPAGSVLWEQGKTIVLATCSIVSGVPAWFSAERRGGWVTANYIMLPGSTPRRKDWPRTGHTDSRGTEIERLIGRCLRAGVDLTKIGPNTLTIDCQILQADGGTRTAAICAGYVALVDALAKLEPRPKQSEGVPVRPWNFGVEGQQPSADAAAAGAEDYDPARAIVDPIAAVSVGVVDGEVRLDLDYVDDVRAAVDMNIAYTGGEVRGGAGVGRERQRL